MKRGVSGDGTVPAETRTHPYIVLHQQHLLKLHLVDKNTHLPILQISLYDLDTVDLMLWYFEGQILFYSEQNGPDFNSSGRILRLSIFMNQNIN